MLNQIMKVFGVIILLAILSSCAATNTTSNSTDTSIEPIVQATNSSTNIIPNRFNYWAVHDPTLPEGLTQKEFLALDKRFRDEAFEKYYHFTKGIIDAPTWQTADQRAQEYLRLTANHYYSFCIQQEVASTMLRSFFMNAKPTAETIKAITFYLGILQKHQYYREINLFVQILPKLNGYWAKEQIHELASSCVAAYNKRYGRNVTPERYFKEVARQQLNTNTINSNVASSQSLDEVKTAQKLRSDFINGLAGRIESYKELNQQLWFHPKDENIITLSLIAE